MLKKSQSLQQLCDDIILYPQTLINLKTNDAETLVKNQQVQAAVKAITAQLNSKGRIVLRASGTEPVLRIMIEGEDLSLVQKQAKQLTKEIKAIERTILH